MALDSSSTVSIQINVVDNNSAAVVGQLESRVASLGAAGTVAGAQMTGFGEALNKLGGAGTVSSQIGQVTQSVAQLGAGLTSTAQAATGFSGATVQAADAASKSLGGVTNNIQGVRLAAQEMGLRVPLAMERLIAGNATLAMGLQATMGLFVAIGAISIFTQLIEGAVNLYEKWMDVNKAVDDYQQKAGLAAQQKLFDTASLEMTVALLREAKQQIGDLKAKQSEGSGESVMPITGFEDMSQYTTADSQAAAKAKETADKLAAHKTALGQQMQTQRLKSQTSYDDAVTQGYAKIAVHEADTEKQINQRYQSEIANQKQLETLANAAGLTVPEVKDSFTAQRNQDLTAAQQEASGQRVALARAENEEIIALQNEAVNSRLTGVALIQSHEEQAIDAEMQKFKDGKLTENGLIEASAAIWEKYENEKLIKMQQEQQMVDKALAAAAQVGDTGMKKISDETQSKIAGISPDLAPATQVGLRVAAEQEGDAQIVAAHQQFAQEIAQIDQRADDRMLGGYARIDAEVTRYISDIEGKFQKLYSGADLSNPAIYAAYLQDYQNMQNAETQIQQNADRERQQLEQKNSEQIAKTEEEAAQITLPAWQAAQQRIIDEYSQRLQKIQQDVNQHVMTEQQGAQAVAAAWDLANAQMQRQMEQTRDQIATQLGDLFNNPAAYMKKKAEDLMFQIMANWILQAEQTSPKLQSIFGWLFGNGAQMSTSTNPGTALGSIFGGHTQGGETLGIPNNLAGGLGGAGSTLTSAGSTLSSSGTMLATSATQLTDAAVQLMDAATELSSSSTSGGAGGGFGGLPGGLFNSGGSGGGGFQPSDINLAPTGSGGVLGTVPGMDMGGITSSTSSLDALGPLLSGALSGSMMGASIGTMILPGIGTAIGAAAGAIGGFLVGMFGDIFGDHGRSKEVKYFQDTTFPGLSKDMQDFQQGVLGYDAASKDLQKLQSDASTQANSFGSGAVSYFNSDIVPQIQAAQATLDRAEKGGRDKISFSAAQFHQGGDISDFGDLWTSPTTGFIHAQLGEHVFTPSQMSSLTSTSQSNPRMVPTSNGTVAQVTIQAWDGASVDRWLRSGGAQKIQAAVNQNTGRYSGVALG